MIRRLEISNYVLIDKLVIEFGPQFNVLTGETGAGKSIILGALGLIKGNRADTKTLKDKTAKCVVEATITMDKSWSDFFAENDIDFHPETIIRREILPSSKSRIFVNDTPVRLVTLQELGKGILSIHQQFDHTQISDPDHQLQLLDWYGGHEKELEAYRGSYEKYKSLRSETDRIARELDRIRKDFQLNEFLLAELEELDLVEQDHHLAEELNFLENAENLSLLFKRFHYEVSENDHSVLNQLLELSKSLNDISVDEKRVLNFRDQLYAVISELEELSSSAQQLDEILEYDEQEVIQKKQRLDRVIELQRKHQVNDLSGLFEKWESLKIYSSSNDELENKLAELQEELRKHKIVLDEKAKLLSKVRKKSVPGFTEEWIGILKELAMPNIRIEGLIEALDDYSSDGQDQLLLRIAVNKGSDLELIADVASGGEISRMALAVQSMISNQLETSTLVFDEIDTGVSGEVSSRMGAMLQKMSKDKQIICITHSPQIAAKADLQWKVYKKDLHDVTISEIVLLDNQGRIDEIAGMLSGMETTEAARQNAKVLLDNQ